MTVLITLVIPPGGDVNNFNLYSDATGYSIPFAINISAAVLTAGYTTSAVPNGTTIIRATSTGLCTNYIDINVTLLPPATTTTTSSSTSTTTSTSTSTSTTTSTSSTSTTTTTATPTTTTTTTSGAVYCYEITSCIGGFTRYANYTGSLSSVNVSYLPISGSMSDDCGIVGPTPVYAIPNVNIVGSISGCGDPSCAT